MVIYMSVALRVAFLQTVFWIFTRTCTAFHRKRKKIAVEVYISIFANFVVKVHRPNPSSICKFLLRLLDELSVSTDDGFKEQGLASRKKAYRRGEGRGRRRECDDGCRDGGHDGIRGFQFFQEANLLKQICLLLGCIFEVTSHLIVLGLGISKS